MIQNNQIVPRRSLPPAGRQTRQVDSFEQVVDAFLEAKLVANRARNTIVYYQNILGQFQRMHPNWPPTYEKVVNFLIAKKETCSKYTIYKLHKGLTAFLNWCDKFGYLPQNPVDLLDSPRRPHKLPKPATPETIKALFTILDQHAEFGEVMAIRDRALFRLAYDTGARATELATLELENLDLDWGKVLISCAKNDRERSVFFGQKCQTSLQDWLVFHPGGAWLFPNRFRTELQPLTRRGVLNSVKKWSALADVKLTVHQIRHTYATHALRQGIDIGLIQHQMGHTRLETTAIYLGVDDEMRRQAHQSGVLGDKL